MSWGAFGKNFAEAVPAGVAWGQAIQQTQDRDALKEANVVLSEAEAFDPWAAYAAANEPQAGLPDAETAGMDSTKGFDGSDWQSYKERYMDALSKIGNVDIYTKAQDRLADIEKTKVLSYLDAAIMQSKSGNATSARRNLQAASAFLNPGVTPDIQTDERGNFIVTNRDGEGNMLGGYAITTENLMDLRHQYSNFEDYRKFAFDRSKWQQQYALQAAKHNASMKKAEMEMEFAMNEEQRAAQAHALDMTGKRLANGLRGIQLDIADATKSGVIGATNSKNETAMMEDAATREAIPSATEATISENEERTRVAQEKEAGELDERTKTWQEQWITDTSMEVPGVDYDDMGDPVTTLKTQRQPFWAKPEIDAVANTAARSIIEQNKNVSDEQIDAAIRGTIGPLSLGAEEGNTVYQLHDDGKGGFWIKSPGYDLKISQTGYEALEYARKQLQISQMEAEAAVLAEDQGIPLDAAFAAVQNAPARQGGIVQSATPGAPSAPSGGGLPDAPADDSVSRTPQMQPPPTPDAAIPAQPSPTPAAQQAGAPTRQSVNALLKQQNYNALVNMGFMTPEEVNMVQQSTGMARVQLMRDLGIRMQQLPPQ